MTSKLDMIRRMDRILRMLESPGVIQVVEQDNQLRLSGVPLSKRQSVGVEMIKIAQESQRVRIKELEIELEQLEGSLFMMLKPKKDAREGSTDNV